MNFHQPWFCVHARDDAPADGTYRRDVLTDGTSLSGWHVGFKVSDRYYGGGCAVVRTGTVEILY